MQIKRETNKITNQNSYLTKISNRIKQLNETRNHLNKKELLACRFFSNNCNLYIIEISILARLPKKNIFQLG